MRWCSGSRIRLLPIPCARFPVCISCFMRAKLRTPAGRNLYQRRQAVVEPVFGILKEQRGMRKFRRRGLAAVTTEWMLAAIAYNLTRMARTTS